MENLNPAVLVISDDRLLVQSVQTALRDQSVRVAPVNDPHARRIVAIATNAAPTATLGELADAYIDLVLEQTGGNRTAAAKVLGIDRKTLYKRLQKRGLPETVSV